MMPPEYHRDRYQTLKGLGLCTACGEKEPEYGKSRCHDCLGKRKESMRQLRARTPLPPKREKPRRVGTPPPRIKPGRVEDPAYLAKVRDLPCLACKLDGTDQTSPTEAHHVRRKADGTLYGASQKAHDTETIPLCQKRHHWNGVHCASKVSHRVFEARYGYEHHLVVMTRQQLGVDDKERD